MRIFDENCRNLQMLANLNRTLRASLIQENSDCAIAKIVAHMKADFRNPLMLHEQYSILKYTQITSNLSVSLCCINIMQKSINTGDK